MQQFVYFLCCPAVIVALFSFTDLTLYATHGFIQHAFRSWS